MDFFNMIPRSRLCNQSYIEIMVLYHRPGSFRGLHNILAVPSKRPLMLCLDWTAGAAHLFWGIKLLIVLLPLKWLWFLPSTSAPVVSSALVLLNFLLRLLSDVAVSWNCYIYHNCSPLLFINHHCVCLVGQQLLVSLELEVSWDLSPCSWPPSVVSPSSTLGLLVHVQHRCSCTLFKLHGCASQFMLSQLAAYILLLCAGLSLGSCWLW